MSKTTIKTSDGKEYEIENDGLILKSEALKQIYEKSIGINNHDTQNGLAGAFNIIWGMHPSKKYIDGDLLFSKIAGHSNYHGDSILSAISCLQEGKEISTIPAIGDNEMRTIDADILEIEIYKLRDNQCDNLERNRAINDVFTVIAFLLGEIPCSTCANRDKTKIIQNCGEIYKCEEYSHFKDEREK